MVLVLGNGKSVSPARTTRQAASRRGNPLYAIGRVRLARLIRRLSAWRQNAASGRDLATLNEYYLKDIGLSRHDIPPDPSPLFRLW